MPFRVALRVGDRGSIEAWGVYGLCKGNVPK